MNDKLFFTTFLKSKDIKLRFEEVADFKKSICESLKLIFAIDYAEDQQQSVVAKKLLSELMTQNDKQWPILMKMRNRKIDVFDGAEEGIVTMFVNSISDELRLRSRKYKSNSNKEKTDAWEYLKAMSRARAEFYREKFDLGNELKNFQKEGVEYAKKIISKRKMLRWGIGIGAGAAALGLVAMGVLARKNDKSKNKKSEK